MNKEDLLRKKAALEEALTVITNSLNEPYYKDGFKFKFENPITEDMFNHPVLKMVISTLRSKNLGFVPDLAIQHIEKEALEQFNEVFTGVIRGMNVEQLMAVQHELELFEMSDRVKRHSEQLVLINEELDGLVEVKKIKKTKKKQ